MFTLLIYIVIAGLIIAWLTTFFTIVKQKTAETIEVFGKFSSVKHAGLNLKPPFPFGLVAGTLSLQIRELSSNVNVKSNDKAFLIVPVNVQFKVIDTKVKEAFYELDNPEEQMSSYIFNMVRSKAAEFSMDELFASKDSFEEDVKAGLNERFSPFGYEIINVLVDDPQPSKEVVDAFNRVLAAEREKDAAINEAEALRIKLVGEAKAEKESLILKGEAFKTYRSKIAEGNVEALGLMRGTHEVIIEKENVNGLEVEKRVYKEKEQQQNSKLSEKDILDFFAGVDQREAIRDAARYDGNTVVVPVGTNGTQEYDYSKLAGLVKALETKS